MTISIERFIAFYRSVLCLFYIVDTVETFTFGFKIECSFNHLEETNIYKYICQI